MWHKYATSWWNVEHWWTTSDQHKETGNTCYCVARCQRCSSRRLAGTMQKNINVLYIPIKTFWLVDIRGIPFVHATALRLVLVPCTMLPHTHHHPTAATSRPEQQSISLITDVLKCVRTVIILWRVPALYEVNRRLQSCRCLKWNLGTKQTCIQRKILLYRWSKIQVPVRNGTCLQRKKIWSLAVPYFSLCSLQLLHLT